MPLPIPPTADRLLPSEGWAIPVRLIVGYGFMAHGWAKLAHGPQHFIDILHAIGIPFAPLMGWLTIVGELACGAAVLAGAFIPLVSLPMIAILLVAIVTVHLPNGFSSIKLQGFDAMGAHFGQPGYETDLLYLAGILALILGGPGPLSVSAWLSRRAARATKAT